MLVYINIVWGQAFSAGESSSSWCSRDPLLVVCLGLSPPLLFTLEFPANSGVRPFWPTIKLSCTCETEFVLGRAILPVDGLIWSHRLRVWAQASSYMLPDEADLQSSLDYLTSNSVTHSHWHVIKGLRCQTQGVSNSLLCNAPLSNLCTLSSLRTSCWPVPDL